MKKVALLAPYFLPRRRVGAWRPFKFAIHLQEFGWEPHVITIQTDGGSLTEREQELLDPIPIYPVRPPFDFTRQRESPYRFNGSLQHAVPDGGGQQQSLLSPLLGWIDKHFPIDTWLPLFALQRGQVEGYVRSINPDLLWSTGDPWSSHWLAGQLARKFQLPWVADFRDPWTLGDLRLKNRSSMARRMDRRYERQVVQEASCLTFTSQRTEQLYANRYAAEIQSTETIYNSFDSVLFKEPNASSRHFDNDYLNLVFFGTFRPLSPARPFIALLDRLNRRAPEVASRIRMHSFGPLDREEQAIVRSRGLTANFNQFSPIPLEEALPVLRQADILWLSTHQRRENIIPAKLWDYLAARRPIISVAPNPEIRQILQQTGAGVQFGIGQQQVICSLLAECVEARQNGAELPIATRFDDEAIKRYDADVATQKLTAIFDRLT